MTAQRDQQLSEVPLQARIMLSHAYFQRLAEINSIDLLHVKGYAFGTDAYREGRKSTDADLLVRPAHVDRFMRILEEAGWSILTRFTTGSIFEHASTVYHPTWGLADIHQYFPGIGFDNPSAVFENLWQNRRTKTIAHYLCTVPSLVDSQLIVIVHAARSHAKLHPDIEHLKNALDDGQWAEIADRAHELHAEIAFDTALGKLSQHKDHPHYLMWKAISEDVPVFVEWWARVKRAKGLAKKIQVVWGIATVNEDHLAMRLGHSPDREEKRTYFFSRWSKVVGK